MPKEMSDLVMHFPTMQRHLMLWRYNEAEGDFEPVYSSTKSPGVVIECIMNPRELCSRHTMADLGAIILAHMNVSPSRIVFHAVLYTQNIVDRTYDM